MPLFEASAPQTLSARYRIYWCVLLGLLCAAARYKQLSNEMSFLWTAVDYRQPLEGGRL